MADAQYRYQQPRAGPHFYQQQNQQNFHHRQYPRNGSPVNSGRGGYTNDTPSPSRSPVSQASNHHSFGLYNQGHQQGQHMMMNGGGHQPYMQMNIGHKFQHQNHQQHHGQQNHHHHQDHAGNPNGQMGHQHSFSSGTMSNATPHFTPSAMHNGVAGNNSQALSEEVHPNWADQLKMVDEARQPVVPHRHAKKEGQVSLKGPQQRSADELTAEGVDERNRHTMDGTVSRQSWDALDLSGQGLRALSLPLFDNFSFLTRLFLDNNSLTHLSPEVGQLRQLTYLSLSNNLLVAIPPEIGMLNNMETLLLFDNKLREIPLEIGYLCKLEHLGIDGNMDLDDETKEVVVRQGAKALVERLREYIEAGTPPKSREWIEMDDTPAAETLAVVSYNILCDKYATKAQYGYTPSRALAWEYRSKLILREIQDHDADFVCLQEVDMESYNDLFRTQLVHNDYHGVFWPKTRAKTMGEREAKLVDGCANFYKKSKYELLQKEFIDFSNLAINRPDMKGEHDVFNRVMTKDNIAVLTFFQNRITGSRVIVVNAHIHWDPHFADVKLVQVAILMEQIDKFADQWSHEPPRTCKKAFALSEVDGDLESPTPEPSPTPGPSLEYSSGSQIPLIICGDFNTSLGSGVYDLITQGKVAPNHSDFKNRSYGNFTRDGVAHKFSIKSSYTGTDEISFTNYTPHFVGVIDYIWYSTNSLQVRGLLGDVDLEHLRRVPGFPNWHFPSDHLALKAEFAVKPRKDRKER